MSLTADFQERVLPVKHKLYRFAYRLLGNGQEAEDVVQEVMIKIWTRRQEMHTYLKYGSLVYAPYTESLIRFIES